MGNAASSVIVLLDFNGGESPIFPQQRFAALDPALFVVRDGGTLADEFDSFQQAVLDRVIEILSDALDQPVIALDRVEPGETVDVTVLLTQATAPRGGSRIGEGEYDPCNSTEEDSAVIFGQSIRRLAVGRSFSFDDWVAVFANVSAHEAAHTLGFGHIERSTIESSPRPAIVELMLDGHTIDEMRREQRAITPQSLCPATEEQPVLAASSAQ